MHIDITQIDNACIDINKQPDLNDRVPQIVILLCGQRKMRLKSHGVFLSNDVYLMNLRLASQRAVTKSLSSLESLYPLWYIKTSL